MTTNDERRLAEELEKHTAGQEADLPNELKTVSDSLEQAMRHTHPRPGFVNELAGQLHARQDEKAGHEPSAGMLPWLKRLLAGAAGIAAIVVFALFVSNLFSGPPVAPVDPDRQTATPPPAATPTAATLSPPQSGALSMPPACIPEYGDHVPYVNITAGYCFQYPVAFTVGDVLPQGAPNAEDILAIYGPAYDAALEPLRAGLNIIVIGPANGLTLEEVVQQEVVSTLGGDEITTRDTTLGGEPAVILEGLPGPVAFKEMLVTVHGGQVYELSVMPIGADNEDVAGDAERLWRAVLDTFAFLTPDELAQFSACPLHDAPYVSLLHGYCLSYPSQFDLVQLRGSLNISALIPSPYEDDIPWFREGISVSRSDVQPDYDLQTLADDIAAEFPDVEIVRDASLGSAPAIIVDNLDSASGTRSLHAHRGDTLYQIIFPPTDDSAQAAELLETVWDAVIDSFTFLPRLPEVAPVVHNEATLEPPPVLPPTPTPPSPDDFPHHQNAVYVAPADDLPVSQSQFYYLEIDVVPTVADLQARLQSETVEIIYLHPAAFREIPGETLRRLYDEGILIVILNVPASEIGEKLPVLSTYDDLAPHYFVSDEQFVAAAAHKQDDLVDAGGSTWTHRDFYLAGYFWSLVATVESQWRNLATPLTSTAVATPPPVPFITPTPFPGTAQPGPTVPPTPHVTPTPQPTQTGQDTPCSDVPRPALVFGGPVTLDSLRLFILDPLSDARCNITIDAYAQGAIAASGNTLTYPRRDRDAGTITLWQQPLDGRATPLAFTTTPALSAPWFGLAVAPDEQQLVWATFEEHSVDPEARFRSSVWLGDLQTETAALLWQEDEPDTFPSTIEPFHISPQENVVYFARRPYGIGGTGPLPAQYNALYALSLDGGEPQPIFESATEFDFGLNDVDFERRLLTTVGGTQNQPELQILDFDGALVARYAPADANYLAHPIIGPNGEVAFVAANLQETEPGAFAYQPGAVHLLTPPYTDEPRELFSTTDIVFRLSRWIDARHLVALNLTGHHDLALLTLDGDSVPIPQSTDADLRAILRE